MNALPKMGRPSITGLSVKLMGKREYARAYNQMRPAPRKTSRRRWTGLRAKLMSRAEYVREWRSMRRNQLNLLAMSKSGLQDAPGRIQGVLTLADDQNASYPPKSGQRSGNLTHNHTPAFGQNHNQQEK